MKTILRCGCPFYYLSLIILLSICPLFAQLSGTYTIGPSGSYATFNTAVSALENQGVSGPVIFEVQDGVYNEQVVINGITGASEANLIVFQSASGDSDKVILKYAAAGEADNYVIRFNGGSYIIFKQITIRTGKGMYAKGVVLENFSAHIRFLNCLLKGNYHGDAMARYHLVSVNVPHVHHLSFENCRLDSAGTGININTGTQDHPMQGVYIANNHFTNMGYTSMYLNIAYAPQIRNNHIQATSIGIRMTQTSGPAVIEKNRVVSSNTGMELRLSGNTVNHALVANNFIYSGESEGLEISGEYIDIYHNSIYSNSPYPASHALYIYGTANTYGINVVNNNIGRMRAGKALYVYPASSINDFQNNNLYTAGNTLAIWNSQECDDLAELQLNSGKNENSLSVYPHFLSSTDLHTVAPWLDGKGLPLAGITDDIDGEPRDANHPDIGADEFMPDPATLTPLAGSYTVGSGVYPTIQSAIDDAVLKGISAPVIFNIQPGTYNEQLNIYSIPGSGANRRVTLRSASGDTADVRITYNSTDQDSNYTILNFGADFITYEGLTMQALNGTYGRVLHLYHGSDSIEVRHCRLIGVTASGAQAHKVLVYSNDSYYRKRVLTGNTFERGSYAVYMRRDGNEYKHSKHTEITRNTVLNNDFAGFYLQFYDGLVVNENTIHSKSYGIRCITSDNAVQILKNRILLTSGSGAGIMLSSCLASEVNPGLIANNFVSAITSGATTGIDLGHVTFLNVYNNSVNIVGTSGDARAFELTHSSSSDVNVVNNNFACLMNGYAYVVERASIVNVSDYNNFYSPGNFLARWDGQTLYDFSELQAVSGKDVHSLSVYPHYISDTDLHTRAPWLDNHGIPLNEVPDDIDGQPRHAMNPDIGADEFSADPAYSTPLAGAYTIGTSGNYSTIQEAFNDALLKGVSEAVVFDLLPGTYQEQVTITAIPGANSQKSITLRPQSGDTSDVEITFSATQSDKNYVLQFYGADFISLESLKITASNATYARVIDFYLGADSLHLKGNVFKSIYNTNNNTIKAILFSDNSYYYSRIIEDNIFKDCSHGIYLRRESTTVPYPKGAILKNNQLKNCGYLGIFLQFHDAPQIIGNGIIAGSYGIQTSTCPNALRILKNKIIVNTQTGLYLSGCNGTVDQTGLIANNFVYVGGAGTANGINIGGSNYQHLVFNSVHVASTHTTNGRSFNSSSGGNLRVKNNIFANSGGGYAYYNATPAAISASDYNDLYTIGTNLAYWNGNRTDLAALRAASGMEAHSLSVDPQFTSATDLHIANAALDGKGSPFAGVSDDIDGQNRHPLTPDIGADEFFIGENHPPVVVNPIPDQVFPEDSPPQTIVQDLNTVFEDNDENDYLFFRAGSDNAGIIVTINNNALTLSFVPDFYGVGQVTVTAEDLAGNTCQDVFQVTVTPVPDPPIAVDDYVIVAVNNAIDIKPLNNDSDPDGGEIHVYAIGIPLHGQATILADQVTIRYTPDTNFSGSDSLFYIIENQSQLRDTAMIYIDVRSVFSEYPAALPGVSNGTAIWVDIDLDGKLDLFIMGATDNSNTAITRIYKNGITPFTSHISFPGQIPDNPQGAAFGDFNNDGYPDLIITGKVSGDPFTIRTRIYRNVNGHSFQEMTTDVIDIWGGSVTWIDYDLDGDLDLLVSGSRTSDLYQEVTKLYRNDGPDGSNGWKFTEVTMPELPQLSRTAVCWFDFDNDGDPDLLISGMTPDFYTVLLRNDNGQFNPVETDLPAFADGQWNWYDFDADGDPDLFFSGYTGGTMESAAGIYRNDGPDGNGGWKFTLLETGIESVSFASSFWIDFDNDGDADIFLSGRNAMGARHTALYENNDGVFTLASASLPIVANSGSAWGDFNNDGRVDVVLTGMDADGQRRTVILQNNTPAANTPPSAPHYRGVGLNYGSMTLVWSPAVDAETPAASLTYNICVGTTEDGMETVSPLSDINTGFRHVVASGNVYGDTSWTIHGVTEGKLYYVRIQAIDGAYSGSPFTTVRKIAMASRHFREVATEIPGLVYAAAAFADYDGSGRHDLIAAGRTNEGLEQTQIYLYNPGSGAMASTGMEIQNAQKPSLDWRDFNGDGDMDLLLSGLDPRPGPATYFTRIYDYQNGVFSPMEHDFPGSWEGDTKLIDFDNDGDLDVMIMGHTWTLPFAYLFINNNGVFYDSGIEFTGLYMGSQAWCDYDLDGDMDVIMTGISNTSHANTILYRNDGHTFTPVETDLMQVCKGNAAWGDMDMDGDADLLLSGEMFDGQSWTSSTKIYENVDGVLVEYFTLPEGIKQGRALWGDVNNDGVLDVIMTGYKPAETPGYAIPVNRIYLNDNGNFTLLDTYLGNMGDGTVALGDMDGDNDLDVFFCGRNAENVYESKLFRNTHTAKNTPPTAPGGLSAEHTDSLVVFRWNAASDEQTATPGLTYNIRVGTSPGGRQLVNPQSDSSGFRMVPEPGNAGHRLSYTLKLRTIPGVLYWSVQAVDNSYAGSPFAPEEILLINSLDQSDFVVTRHALHQNYPNPFNPATTITFDLPEGDKVRLVLYNVLGQEVAVLLNQPFTAGRHRHSFDASAYAAGLYFYKLEAGSFKQVRKMLLIK